MEKKVSFKKDIEFDSIYQISSISLEHDFKVNDNVVSGNFILSGTYKTTESSVTIDEFNHNLPFEIKIDNKYDTSDITVDISDFYYEVFDEKNLCLNIEIIINNLEEIREEKKEEPLSVEENETITYEEKGSKIDSIFDGLDYNEKYVTYRVHIVTDNDSSQSIIQKYKIKKSVLEEYNDISDLKVGDKIIIPADESK